MDQIKNLKDDPEKLEAVLKEYWKKFDTTGKGFVTPEEFAKVSLEIHKGLGAPIPEKPSAEEQEKIQKLIDPEKTGKITYEQYKKLTLYSLEKV